MSATSSANWLRWTRRRGCVAIVLLGSVLAARGAESRSRDAVVRIGGCSGVCVDPAGLILTARHCSLGPREEVVFPGRDAVVAERVFEGPDVEDAVAFVLPIDARPAEGWPFLPVANAVPVSGAEVWSGGYPDGPSGRVFRVTRGMLVGGGEHELRRNGEPAGRFPANDTDLVTGPGWSGGPLVGADGRVIGLLSAGNRRGSTFLSWAATRRAYEAARATLQSRERPHLLVFGFGDCPHCKTFLADLAAGRFAAYEVEYVDVQQPAGRRRYEALHRALVTATGSTPPPGFPAFHVAGRAAMTVGYASGKVGWERLLGWVRETLRLPVTGFDAVTGHGDGGVSPDPGPPPDGSSPIGPNLGPATSLPDGQAPPGPPPLPGDDESLPWWALVAGSLLRLIEERLMRTNDSDDENGKGVRS